MNSLSDLLAGRDDLPTSTDTTDNLDNPNLTSNTLSPSTQVDLQKIKSMAYTMRDQLDAIIRTLNGESVRQHEAMEPDVTHLGNGERVVEGVFNGELMIGSDGREYSIPPNYSSKSKLVEGDIMKLTITNKGSFVYKQIGPIERRRLVGELVTDSSTGQWSVLVDGRAYKVLTASVTFFRGKAGDEAVILVPKEGDSDWGAVENIIGK